MIKDDMIENLNTRIVHLEKIVKRELEAMSEIVELQREYYEYSKELVATILKIGGKQ